MKFLIYYTLLISATMMVLMMTSLSSSWQIGLVAQAQTVSCPSTYLYPHIRAIPSDNSEYKVNSIEYSARLDMLVMGGKVRYPKNVSYASDLNASTGETIKGDLPNSAGVRSAQNLILQPLASQSLMKEYVVCCAEEIVAVRLWHFENSSWQAEITSLIKDAQGWSTFDTATTEVATILFKSGPYSFKLYSVSIRSIVATSSSSGSVSTPSSTAYEVKYVADTLREFHFESTSGAIGDLFRLNQMNFRVHYLVDNRMVATLSTSLATGYVDIIRASNAKHYSLLIAPNSAFFPNAHVWKPDSKSVIYAAGHYLSDSTSVPALRKPYILEANLVSKTSAVFEVDVAFFGDPNDSLADPYTVANLGFLQIQGENQLVYVLTTDYQNGNWEQGHLSMRFCVLLLENDPVDRYCQKLIYTKAGSPSVLTRAELIELSCGSHSCNSILAVKSSEITKISSRQANSFLFLKFGFKASDTATKRIQIQEVQMIAEGDNYSLRGYGIGAFGTFKIDSVQTTVGWIPVQTSNNYYKNANLDTDDDDDQNSNSFFGTNAVGTLLLSNSPKDCCDKTHELNTLTSAYSLSQLTDTKVASTWTAGLIDQFISWTAFETGDSTKYPSASESTASFVIRERHIVDYNSSVNSKVANDADPWKSCAWERLNDQEEVKQIEYQIPYWTTTSSEYFPAETPGGVKLDADKSFNCKDDIIYTDLLFIGYKNGTLVNSVLMSELVQCTTEQIYSGDETCILKKAMNSIKRESSNLGAQNSYKFQITAKFDDYVFVSSALSLKIKAIYSSRENGNLVYDVLEIRFTELIDGSNFQIPRVAFDQAYQLPTSNLVQITCVKDQESTSTIASIEVVEAQGPLTTSQEIEVNVAGFFETGSQYIKFKLDGNQLQVTTFLSDDIFEKFQMNLPARISSLTKSEVNGFKLVQQSITIDTTINISYVKYPENPFTQPIQVKVQRLVSLNQESGTVESSSAVVKTNSTTQATQKDTIQNENRLNQGQRNQTDSSYDSDGEPNSNSYSQGSQSSKSEILSEMQSQKELSKTVRTGTMDSSKVKNKVDELQFIIFEKEMTLDYALQVIFKANDTINNQEPNNDESFDLTQFFEDRGYSQGQQTENTQNLKEIEMNFLKKKTNIPFVDKMQNDGTAKLKFPHKIKQPRFDDIFKRMAVLGINNRKLQALDPGLQENQDQNTNTDLQKLGLSENQKIERLLKITNSIKVNFLKPEYMIQSSDSEEETAEDIVFDWFLEEFTQEALKIRIKIGQDIQITQERLMQIKFVNTIFYMLPLDDRFSAPPDGLILEEIVPPRVFNKFDSLQVVAETEGKNTSNLIILSTFLGGFLFSLSMSTILGSILALQFLGHMPLFQITLPPNAMVYFQIIVEIVAFEFVVMDSFYDPYFTDTEPYGNTFYFLKYETSNFVENMGLLMVFSFLFTILLLTSLFAFLLRCQCKNTLCRNLTNRQVIKAQTVSFVQSIFFELAISVVISTRLIYLWEILQFWDFLSIIIWALGTILVIAYIFFVIVYAWKKIPRLTALRRVQIKEKHDKVLAQIRNSFKVKSKNKRIRMSQRTLSKELDGIIMKRQISLSTLKLKTINVTEADFESYKVFFDGIKDYDSWALMNEPIMTVKRLLFIWLATYFESTFLWFQLIGFFEMVLIHAAYYISIKPFRRNFQNFLSIFNEFIVLVLIMLTLCLAAYADEIIALEIGNIMVYTIWVAWVINMLVIIVSQFRQFLFYCKKSYFKNRSKLSKLKSGFSTQKRGIKRSIQTSTTGLATSLTSNNSAFSLEKSNKEQLDLQMNSQNDNSLPGRMLQSVEKKMLSLTKTKHVGLIVTDEEALESSSLESEIEMIKDFHMLKVIEDVSGESENSSNQGSISARNYSQLDKSIESSRQHQSYTRTFSKQTTEKTQSEKHQKYKSQNEPNIEEILDLYELDISANQDQS